MPQLRIRTPFAAAFAVFCLISGYLGLFKQTLPSYGHSDKGLHFIAFFILTLTFYWILETSRRRVIHLTLVVCTAGLSIGSEVVQAYLPNGRSFDPYDILSNVLGSAAALAACSWYHKRMLERRRQSKHYDIVPGDELGDDPERDVELGEGVGGQETGVITARKTSDTQAGASAEPGKKSVTEELDNWDENAEDWEEGADANGATDPAKKDSESKKRAE